MDATRRPESAPRVTPREVRESQERGDPVLLVCAYDDEAKCRALALDGSISLAELERRDPDRSQQLVFYCA